MFNRYQIIFSVQLQVSDSQGCSWKHATVPATPTCEVCRLTWSRCLLPLALSCQYRLRDQFNIWHILCAVTVSCRAWGWVGDLMAFPPLRCPCSSVPPSMVSLPRVLHQAAAGGCLLDRESPQEGDTVTTATSKGTAVLEKAFLRNGFNL